MRELLRWLMALLPVSGGRTVKIVDSGEGPPVVFLHSGVGSAGEWREAFSLWPQRHRLIAVDAYRDGTGPFAPGRRTLDNFVDQVRAVVEYVAEPVHLIGFSWGGATALQLAATAPTALASLAVIEPEAYSLLKEGNGPGFVAICELRDRWREHVRAGDWYEALAEFVDFYNGPGSFASWPAARRDVFIDDQRSKGDLWDVLFDAPITAGTLASLAMPVHVVEGSATTVVDRAIGEVLRGHLPRVEHTVIEGAGHMMPLTHAAKLSQALVRRLP